LVAANQLQHHIAVVQKLSSQLTVAAAGLPHESATTTAASTPAAAAAKHRAQKQQPSAPKQQQQQQGKQSQPADMPAKAALVVHEIFGSDPLSEHLLPAMQQVQQQLAAPGAVFLPSRVRVIAAVAVCPALLQCTRISSGTLSAATGPPAAAAAATAVATEAITAAAVGTGTWDTSSLVPLQPRKCEVQLSDLQDDLVLLTEPQSVLEFDLQQPVKLSGKQQVQLPTLQQRLRLADWMQQQQTSGEQRAAAFALPAAAEAAIMAPAAAAAAFALPAAAEAAIMAPAAAAAGEEEELLVVSWFEADCGAGGWLSTAPGTTPLGHWQQSVEFVRSSTAVALHRTAQSGSGGGSSGSSGSGSGVAAGVAGPTLTLQVSWTHDRLSFTMA
jgi:hypothetical protein